MWVEPPAAWTARLPIAEPVGIANLLVPILGSTKNKKGSFEEENIGDMNNYEESSRSK